MFGILKKEEIILKGCNIHVLDYRAYSDNSILFSERVSTIRQCIEDSDQQFLDALQSIDEF